MENFITSINFFLSFLSTEPSYISLHFMFEEMLQDQSQSKIKLVSYYLMFFYSKKKEKKVEY